MVRLNALWWRRVCLAAILVGCSIHSGLAQTKGAPAWPQLRHTNYVALLAEAGTPIEASLACKHHGTYEDTLVYRLIDGASEEVLVGEVLPEESATIALQPKRTGLHVLVLSSGWNVATIDLGELPHAIVVKPDVPLQTVRRVERLYFYVPKGMRAFDLLVSASVTSEGLRFQVFDPGGKVVIDEDGDFDAERKLAVTVPAGADGRAWSLAILEPRTPGMGLDDVMLRLDEKLPPYLAKKPEWAVAFGKRRHP
ncbi:MAG: hypothetical protein PVH68_11870 [Armatimonadota bacterium]|jgi:hypothetical protein